LPVGNPPYTFVYPPKIKITWEIKKDKAVNYLTLSPDLASRITTSVLANIFPAAEAAAAISAHKYSFFFDCHEQPPKKDILGNRQIRILCVHFIRFFQK
jgi:hypothetical protein